MMWSVLLPVIASALGYLGKRFIEERKWKQVREVARAIGEDKQRTNDPAQAIAEALIETQLDRVLVEAKKVRESFYQNGHTPPHGTKIPVLNIELHELSNKRKKGR